MNSAIRAYVLITAAHNEEAYIGQALVSLLSQTVLPLRWVVVSDGSTDRTDAIVEKHARLHGFIELVRIDKRHSRDFASKVNAINAGYQRLKNLDYKFVGILDADVSFGPDYYSQILDKFEENPRLGIAGGFIFEHQGEQFRSRKSNSGRSVAGAIQLFRRECYETIGGVLPLRYGAEDWFAEISARMKGWEVRAFPEFKVLHRRLTGTADHLLRHWFRQGRADYSVGSHPLFEMVKCLKRIPERPIGAGALARLAGFAWSSCRSEKRPVSPESVDFLRREQTGRLRALIQTQFLHPLGVAPTSPLDNTDSR